MFFMRTGSGGFEPHAYGTAGDDQITVYRRSRDKHIVVRVNDVVRSFHRSRVHAASIYGYGGDDVIDVSRSKRRPS